MIRRASCDMVRSSSRAAASSAARSSGSILIFKLALFVIPPVVTHSGAECNVVTHMCCVIVLTVLQCNAHMLVSEGAVPSTAGTSDDEQHHPDRVTGHE